MKQESKTIRESRAWADAYCASLEGHWSPADALLNTFLVWDKAVRDCRGRNPIYIYRRYECLSLSTLIMRREKALFDLINGHSPSPEDS